MELPDSVYEDSGLDTPDDSGGSSGGGDNFASAYADGDPAPGSDDFDDAAQDIVTDNMEDQGFVADADQTSGGGAVATRSPDEGDDFTELGEDVHNSPEVTVEDDLGGRFVGDVFDQLRETGTAAVDTSEAGNRSAAAADAVAYGNEIAGATFEALNPSALDTSELREQFPIPELPTDESNRGLLLAAAAAGVALLLGGGVAVMDDGGA